MPSPEIVFSNGNLAQSRLTLQSAAAHGRYARKAGYDGVEWIPIPWYHRAKNVIGAVNSRQLALNSLHQTFRTDRHSRDTNDIGGNKGFKARAIASPLGRVMMPEMVRSTDYMAKVQAGINRRVPGVFYPQQDPQTDRKMLSKAGAEISLFQATDHVARLMGTTNIDDFLETMLGDRGYVGLVLDTLHARRKYGRDESGVVSDPKAFDRLFEHTKAVHLSLNRLDFAKEEPHIQGTVELYDALNGEYFGYQRDVLDAVKESPNVRYVVVELASGALTPSAQNLGLDTQQGYKQIADNLRNELAA